MDTLEELKAENARLRRALPHWDVEEASDGIPQFTLALRRTLAPLFAGDQSGLGYVHWDREKRVWVGYEGGGGLYWGETAGAVMRAIEGLYVLPVCSFSEKSYVQDVDYFMAKLPVGRIGDTPGRPPKPASRARTRKCRHCGGAYTVLT